MTPADDALDPMEIALNTVYAGIGAPHAAMSAKKKSAHQALATVRDDVQRLRDELKLALFANQELGIERDAAEVMLQDKTNELLEAVAGKVDAEAEVRRLTEGLREIIALAKLPEGPYYPRAAKIARALLANSPPNP